jgi:ABC1 atypical kinase-like domain
MLALLKIPYLRMKYKFLPNEAQAFWGQELLNSQGLGAKIGQVLAQGKVSELPKSTLSPADAKRIFKENFQRDIDVDGEALSASMGQVFKIKIDGKVWALKILHPGIKAKLKKEIDNLLLLGKYFAKVKGFSFQTQSFKGFLVEIFEEETDLKREAQFQQKFCQIFAGQERFKIPQVNFTYTNEFMLCQEWVDATLARDLRRFAGLDVFDFFFRSLLQQGILHGDLNDRNWGYSASNEVVVYDYGCSQIVSERRINGLKKLFLNRDVALAFQEFGVRLEATWFKGREQELRDALFGHFSKPSLTPDWSFSQELNAEFGEKIKLLREFTDPWVLLMMRSLFSLIRVYQDRKIPIPIRDFIAPYLAIRNDPEMKIQLHIEIVELGKQVFYMYFPYSTLKNMDNYIPQNVKEKIQEEGVELQELMVQALQKGAVPQEIFDVLVDGRRHRVWLGDL